MTVGGTLVRWCVNVQNCLERSACQLLNVASCTLEIHRVLVWILCDCAFRCVIFGSTAAGRFWRVGEEFFLVC